MEKVKGIEMPAAVDYDVPTAKALGEDGCITFTAYDGGRDKTAKKGKKEDRDKEGK